MTTKMTCGDLLALTERLPHKLRFVWDYDQDVSQEEMAEFPDTTWLWLALEKSCEQCGHWDMVECLGAVGVAEGDAFDVGPVAIEAGLTDSKYPDDSQYHQQDCCREMLQEYLHEMEEKDA
jgi:hypothetical protein